MYCTGIKGICSNCGLEAYQHSHDFVMGNNGTSASMSVDNACTLQEAVKEAKTQLEQGVGQMFDISNGDIDNTMTCFVKNVEFEDMEIL